jgi:Protein of unknown function (DUF3019)
LRQPLSVRFIVFRFIRGKIGLACIVAFLCGGLQSRAGAASDGVGEDIQLELSPRICTLAINDKQCEARVAARWRSPHEESLCLVIVDRPEIKRCWENYSEGTYSIELVFTEDVIFQLKDPELRRVLASEALRVIKEAIRYRHKRRQPWNIFD